MDIFDKREAILDLQQTMLKGRKARDENFLTLVKFENWCSNSGLSGFVQDFEEYELKVINNFGIEHNFETVNNMVLVARKFIKKYGKDFSDSLTDDEDELLSQYDDDFYEILDQYTNAVYTKYL